MDESKYEVSFEIIMRAGDAKSNAMLAVEAAKDSNFEEAKRLLEEAEKGLLAAHEVQTEMIREEAKGNPIEVNIILVHAQDHFSMALNAIDFAGQLIELYEAMDTLKQKCK